MERFAGREPALSFLEGLRRIREAANALKKEFEALAKSKWVVEVTEQVKTLGHALKSTLETFTENVRVSFRGFRTSVKGAWDQFRQTAGDALDRFAAQLKGLRDSADQSIRQLGQRLKGGVGQFLDALLNRKGVKEAWGALQAEVGEAFKSFVTQLKASWKQLSLRELVQSLESAFGALVKSVRTSVKDLGKGLKEAWKQLGKGGLEALVNFGAEFVKKVVKLPATELGQAIQATVGTFVDNLGAAILDRTKSVKAAWKQFLKDLLDLFLSFVTRVALQKVSLASFVPEFIPIGGGGATSADITPDVALNLPVPAGGSGFFAPLRTTTGALSFAGGVAGGSLLGGLLGGGTTGGAIGSQIGSLGGSIAGLALTPVLGPFGPLVGGLLGGALGGGLGGLFGGKKRRRAKRRARERGQLEEQLAALGVDPGLVETFEGAFGQFGTGGGFARSTGLIDLARETGLAGDQATRAFGFALNLDKTLAPALERVRGFGEGALSGLVDAAQKAEAVLARRTPEAIVQGWQQVEAALGEIETSLERVGGALSQGFTNALSSGIQRFLQTGLGTLEALRDGIRGAIESAITEAVVTGTILKGAFGSLLTQLQEALVKGVGDPTAIIGQIGAAIPALAQQLEALLAPLKGALDATFGPSLAPGVSVAAPVMDRGGIVRGPMLAALALNRRPEAVVPLDQAGRLGGETTIIVELNDRILAKALVPLIPGIVRVTTGVARS